MDKTLLAIGAYERDNLGDLLFFLILEHYARKHDIEVVAGSCMASDMRSFIGQYVLPYEFLLREKKFDAIWVVGGEMGACTLDEALAMSIGSQYLDAYSNLSSDTKNIMIKSITGFSSKHLAYLPYIKDVQHTPFIINSVGGFEQLPGRQQAELLHNTIETLQKAVSVSVRNKQTHEYLVSQGVSSSLVPDVVHVISLVHKAQKTISQDYIVFQVNEHLIGQYGIDAFSDALLALMEQYPDCQVKLLLIGTANYHDNSAQYALIQKYIEDKSSHEVVEIIREPDPYRRVDWIANAKLWIGSSLHGRIIAMEYGVPRVSLEVGKVTEYAELWDSAFPINVQPENIAEASSRALSIVEQQKEEVGSKYVQKTHDHLEGLFKKVYGQ